MDTERIRGAIERLRNEIAVNEPPKDLRADLALLLPALDALLPFAPLLEVVERLGEETAEWNVGLEFWDGKYEARYEHFGATGQLDYDGEVRAAAWQEALVLLATKLQAKA